MELVDRFGEDIEFDLRQLLQVDLHDYFRGVRPWAQLHSFLERLPRHGFYKAALANDEEIAKLLNLVEDDEDAPAKPETPWVGYSPEVERLDAVCDTLNLLRETYIAGKGQKPPKPVRATRPTSAAQRQRRVDRQKRLYSLEQQALGG